MPKEVNTESFNAIYNPSLSKALRSALDMSQKDLAQEIGVCASEIGNYEAGNRKLGKERLGQLYYLSQQAGTELPIWFKEETEYRPDEISTHRRKEILDSDLEDITYNEDATRLIREWLGGVSIPELSDSIDKSPSVIFNWETSDTAPISDNLALLSFYAGEEEISTLPLWKKENKERGEYIHYPIPQEYLAGEEAGEFYPFMFPRGNRMPLTKIDFDQYDTELNPGAARRVRRDVSMSPSEFASELNIGTEEVKKYEEGQTPDIGSLGSIYRAAKNLGAEEPLWTSTTSRTTGDSREGLSYLHIGDLEYNRSLTSDLREKLGGMSRRGLGHLIVRHPKIIEDWERGYSKPDLDSLKRVMVAAGQTAIPKIPIWEDQDTGEIIDYEIPQRFLADSSINISDLLKD